MALVVQVALVGLVVLVTLVAPHNISRNGVTYL